MDAGDRTCAGPTVLVDELARSGIRHAVVAPGSRSAPLALALGVHPALRVWSQIDERVAGFFALGLAKADRRAVAIACTSGSAAANLFPAVVEAFHAGVPLVVLTADRPPELRDCGAPQTIDQVRLFGTHARWFADVGPLGADAASLRHARTVACRAVAAAHGPPAGPVHLNLPLREPLVPSAPPGALPPAVHALAPTAAAGRGGMAWSRIARPQLRPDERALVAVADLLRSARRPLIVAGPLDDEDPRLPDAVASLAAALGAPVLAEPASNLRRPVLGEWLADAHDAVLRARAFLDRSPPDAVVRIGALPTSKALAEWLATQERIVQVLLDASGTWPDPAGVIGCVLRGDLATTCQALAATLGPPRTDSAWRQRWLAAGKRARAALDAALAAAPPFEAHAVLALARTLPPVARLYVGSSLAIRALDAFWPPDAPPVRVLANRGANGIDGFVSSVLGAAAAGPETITAGLCGDLTFLHDFGGVLSVSRHGGHAVFLVLDNGGGGIFDHLPVAATGGRYEELFVTPPAVDLGRLVTACGLAYFPVDTPDALPAALRRALHAEHATVVALRIDRVASLAAHRSAVLAATTAVEGEA